MFKIFITFVKTKIKMAQAKEQGTKEQGTVKFFNKTKGYGFIKNSDDGSEIFVHVSGLSVDSIKEGDTVNYEIIETKKGTSAVKVELA